MRHIYCPNNSLTSFPNLTRYSALEELKCSNNQISGELILPGSASSNSTLKTVSCQDNNIANIQCHKAEALGLLDCYNNSIVSLDLGYCIGLRILLCYNNKLIKLILPSESTPLLTSIDCHDNALKWIDLTYCTGLNILNISNNCLNFLDLSNNTSLTSLNAKNNGRTIKAYKYTLRDGSFHYYVPFVAQGAITTSSGTYGPTKSLAELIQDAGLSDADPVITLDNITDWTTGDIQTLPATYGGGQALMINSLDEKAQYNYITNFSGDQTIPWVVDVCAIPEINFFLQFDANDTPTGVDESVIPDTEVPLFAGKGVIYVNEGYNYVAIYNLNGQQIYSGKDRKIIVSPGVYIGKADSKVIKLFVK
jgi:hypothetical protein